MPTMGRLIGAVTFAILAWYTSILIVPQFPEGTDLGLFQEINTVFGLIAGWRIAGPQAGLGWSACISYGITTMVAMVVMALFFNSSVVMLRRSLRKRYDNAGEAIIDVFALFAEHGGMLMTASIAGTLVCGCIIAGFVTEIAGRRYS